MKTLFESTKAKIALGFSLFGLLVLAAVAVLSVHASRYFAKGTLINNIDVSGMTISQLKDIITNYELEVVERESVDEQGDIKTFSESILGKDICLTLGSDEVLEEILNKQNIFSVIFGSKDNYHLSDSISYDEQLLNAKVVDLRNNQKEGSIPAKNAEIGDYNPDTGQFDVISEIPGTILDPQNAMEQVSAAVQNLQEQVDLNSLDCYQHADITEQTEEFQQKLSAMNQLVKAEITYTFGDDKEIVNGERIAKWIKVTKKGKVILQSKKVQKYVENLSKKYDTIFTNRKFETAKGQVVKVTGGDYGWWMNTASETKKLVSLIENGKKKKRTPIYYQKAAAYGKSDLGDTYVEVDLTNQHVYLVEKGTVVFDTPCVTGKENAGMGTPQGTYDITYKQLHATLRGQGYTTPVDYWMPFNGGIGLHDAKWRGTFGGRIYLNSGSHGCVNLPVSAAKQIFDFVKTGMPVICYYVNEQTLRSGKDAKNPKPVATFTPVPISKATATVAPKKTKKPTAKPKKTKKPNKTKKPKKTKEPEEPAIKTTAPIPEPTKDVEPAPSEQPTNEPSDQESEG